MLGDYSSQDNNSAAVIPSFADMGLSMAVLRGLRAAGFQRPSPVQVKAIPLGRLGIDLIVQAKSGTGKTVVFSITALEVVDVKQKAVQAIVISPTREIAFQSAEVIRQLGQFINGLGVQLFVGGIPLADDIKNLLRCQIAVGTPGRIKYLINAGHLDCEAVKLFILDEADLLFSGGASIGPGGLTDEELLAGRNTFPAAINYIWWALPEAKQVMALSATYSEHLVGTHLPRYMRSPALVRLSAHDPSLLGVRQFFSKIQVKSNSPASLFNAKVAELLRIVKEIDFKQCLVFSNFHNSAEQLCESLRRSGWPVNYISSGLDQKERFKAFNSLRGFQCRILVSTDLTSRGIDAENVNLVINLEVPWNRDVYLHRIGRAGRFGSYGASIILIGDTEEEVKKLSRIENPDSVSIHELPDPIPADLATADCPVDFSKLVTVTKLTHDLENGPLPSERKNWRRGGGQSTRKSDAPKKVVQGLAHSPSSQLLLKAAKSVSLDQKHLKKPVKSTPGLMENLNSYVKSMLHKPALGVRLSTDVVTRGSTESPEHLNELENVVLRQISQFLDSSTTENVSESIGGSEDTESVSSNYESSESSQTVQFQAQSTANCTFQLQQDPPQHVQQALTPRQMALWNEYCRLVQWKDYFYQHWLNATQEYDDVLAEYRELTGQTSCSDI
nr:DEAD box ATP dependent RNA helicase [Hymenolepis microstoma]